MPAATEQDRPGWAQRPWGWAAAWAVAGFSVLVAGWLYADQAVPGGLELESLLFLLGVPVLLVVCLLTWLLMLLVPGRASRWVAATPLVVSVVGTFLLVWGFPPSSQS